MESGEFEKEETAVISQQLDYADIFVNVGANAGYYCCLALKKSVHTIAFEPFPRNVKFLEKNLKSNGFDDVEVFPVAISNYTGTIDFYGFGTGASLIEGWAGFSKSYRTCVPCTTLDNALGQRSSGKRAFILVDVEGAEKFVLEGAAGTLRLQPRPVWLVEITVSAMQPKGRSINPHLLDTFRLFFDAGYRAFALDNHEITLKDIELIVSTGKGDLGSNSIIFR